MHYLVVKSERDQSNPHFFDAAIIRIIAASGPLISDLWKQFQNNADNFQGGVKGHPFPARLSVFWSFF